MLINRRLIFFTNRFVHRWVAPAGHDTGIKVYNCITKSKEPLIVKDKNMVTWYTCGPTVYDSSHLGHASCFVKLDIIQRILKKYFNLNVVTVMNITDVDDKIIARSNSLKVSPKDLAERYEKEFWRDLEALGIAKPDITLRVTDNIDLIKRFIDDLLSQGKAYQAEDNSIYFDTKIAPNYGKLQNIGEELSEPNSFKKSSQDFALWKSAKPDEICWQSSWGSGRPGWHVECSALASHVFGSEIDIHAGGLDLRFPHHENEEVQSCAFHKKNQWVNYWLHTGHLHLRNDEKMSKSLKNTISIDELLSKTDPQVFRMACVMSQYRSSMEFTNEFMDTAANLLKHYKHFFDNCCNYLRGFNNAEVNNDILNKLIVNFKHKTHEALIDDFNTPSVIKQMNEIVTEVNTMLGNKKQVMESSKSPSIAALLKIVKDTLDIFGINNNSSASSATSDFSCVMDILNNFRKDIRQIGIENNDKEMLRLCDNVRNSLKHNGIIIKDHGKLSSWSK